MSHHRPAPKESIPLHLPLPEVHERDLFDWLDFRPGQLIRLHDRQQLIIASVTPASQEDQRALCLVRVAWPQDGVLPLGQVVWFSAEQAAAAVPVRLLGAWYHPQSTPPPERIVLEAIRRGFITTRTCGVAWPLCPTMQLSEQAALQIESYLFEVARSTGCAFPFHDIASAMRNMHLAPRADNPALCDIVSERELRRKNPDDLLSFWAREVRQRLHGADFGPLA